MKTTTIDALNAVFNVESDNVEANTESTAAIAIASSTALSTPEEKTEAERKADEDFEFSRGSLKALAVEAQTTLHRAVEAAEQTDKASSFTAVAELLRATIETHKQLHDLHKTSAEIRIASQAGRPTQAQVNIQQGVVFNGTSEELLRLIDKSRQ